MKASNSLARVTGADRSEASDPIDLGELSARFQAEIETWRGSADSSDSIVPQDSTGTTDSTGTPTGVTPDSNTSQIVGLSDSSKASVEAVSDTVEDCTQED